MLDQLHREELALHVTILGWLHILGHAFFLVIGMLGFFLLTGIGVFSGDREAMTILSLVGTLGAAFFGIVALPGLAAGYGLLTRKNWGRILAIIVGVLGLMNFPIGTLVGAYTLWVLLQESATDYFKQPVPA